MTEVNEATLPCCEDTAETKLITSSNNPHEYHILEIESLPTPAEIHVYDMDDPSTITFSRRIARYMSGFEYYFPARPHRPSLDQAWHHYEYITLPRCYDHSDTEVPVCAQNQKQKLLRASTSETEHPTKLYPICGSPLSDLSNFGESTRMYLSTLLVLAAILGMTGLLYLPLMVYFWGYAMTEKDGINYMGVTTIRGSAICDATIWVECDSCNLPQYASYYPTYRLDGTNVQKNACNFEEFRTVGIFSFVSTCLLLCLVAIASWKQQKAEIVFDEAVQTASDYSIRISNPPPDALDPEEWRRFFNRYAVEGKGVVMVTIAINNAELLKLLIKRRKLLQALSQHLPLYVDTHDRQSLERAVVLCKSEKDTFWSWMGLATDVNRLWQDVLQCEDGIRKFCQREYEASTVFVTFATERSQRNALHALSTGKLNIWHQKIDTSNVNGDGTLRVYESMRSSRFTDIGDQQKLHIIQLSVTDSKDCDFSSALLFRNYHVLAVREALEPSDVRWVDLQASKRQRLELYIASTLGMAAFVMCCGLYIYRLVKRFPGYYATLFITFLNIVVPVICEFIGEFESHASEHGKQISLFVKITIFRCFNSAIVLSVISSFVETISVENGNEDRQQSLLFKVYPVIVAELLINPLVDLMDIEGNFRKHILAPRARNQEEMNSYFRGSRFWLAERYTNVNRVVFVALFFASILPEAILLAAMALVAQYYAAKFILLRVSGIPPDLGFHLARTTRNWFMPFVLAAHVIMSAYWWSGYPYDNVCEDNENGGYKFCDQNLYGARVFPPLPRFQSDGNRWMTEDQEFLTRLYSWLSVVVIAAGVGVMVRNIILPSIHGLFRSTYEPDGMDQGIDFLDAKCNQELSGYIPQVEVPGFVYPLLAADINDVDENLIGWIDHAEGYAPHNLFHDVKGIIEPVCHPIFSVVKQYDPKQIS